MFCQECDVMNTSQQLHLLRRLTNLFDSFNGGTRVNPGKRLSCPLIHKVSPYVLLDKLAFLHYPPSQNVWLLVITTAQHEF